MNTGIHWARQIVLDDPTDKSLLQYLAENAVDGVMTVSIAQLASALGRHKRTVTRAAANLEEANLLRRERNWRQDGRQAPNTYVLTLNVSRIDLAS
ncbi:helix-turn-helix transcriptional regulator [Lentzea sp. JNUCC 0626]|uniref:helix-turn-helix transcriptional regulator n=1 Tax=Lentzea sp. JNUCC 0626 TaxID=3367513 RepID=UPI00374A5D5B